jgi:hypothetical protein
MGVRDWFSKFQLLMVGLATAIFALSVFLRFYGQIQIPVLGWTVNFIGLEKPNSFAIPRTDILLGVGTILSAVFAIAFGLSQFVISNIAEKYSPRMLIYFQGNLRYRVAYVLVFSSVLLSVTSLLFIGSWDETFASWMVILEVGLLTISLVAFTFYYSYIYEVVNPIAFSRSVGRSVGRRIPSSPKDVDRLKNGSTALADSAVKAVYRGEEENVKAVLDALEVLAKSAMAAPSVPPTAPRDQTPFEYVLNDISRIHGVASRKHEANITAYIFLKMREMGVSLFDSSDT